MHKFSVAHPGKPAALPLDKIIVGQYPGVLRWSRANGTGICRQAL